MAVVETNEVAVRLWRSLGFEVLATVPEAFDHPERGLVGLHVMFLDLRGQGPRPRRPTPRRAAGAGHAGRARCGQLAAMIDRYASSIRAASATSPGVRAGSSGEPSRIWVCPFSRRISGRS